MTINLKKLLTKQDIIILPPQDVMETFDLIDFHVSTVMLDPWYNRGHGGEKEDYMPWISTVLERSGKISDKIFLWGFPDIICRALGYMPDDYELVSWLTWYYKNCPSIIRGWRSAQYTCLHLGRK